MHKILINFFILIPFFAFSDDSIYLIKDIKVLIENEDIQTARDKAKKIAFDEALDLMLKKIISDADYAKLISLPKIDLVQLIKEFKIKNENFRESLYSAEIDVNFKKDNLNLYIEKNNLKVSNIVSDSFLILAVHKKLNSYYLWEKNNQWYKILKNEYDPNNLLNLYFPEQNYLNKFQISSSDVISENQTKLKEILNFFNKRSGLIVYFDESFSTQDETLKSNIIIKEFNRNYINQILIQDSTYINKMTKSSEIDLFAKFALKELYTWWKNKTSISISEKSKENNFIVYSNFSNLEQSVDLEKKITSSSLIISFTPVKISSDSITYQLKSFADIEKINLSIIPNGIKLIEEKNNEFFILKIN